MMYVFYKALRILTHLTFYMKSGFLTNPQFKSKTASRISKLKRRVMKHKSGLKPGCEANARPLIQMRVKR